MKEQKKIPTAESSQSLYVQSDKLYKIIEKLGEEAFLKYGPLFKFRETTLLEKLIDHFESTEEYEKCSVLLEIKNKIFS